MRIIKTKLCENQEKLDILGTLEEKQVVQIYHLLMANVVIMALNMHLIL